jgi:hypothetical protein
VTHERNRLVQKLLDGVPFRDAGQPALSRRHSPGILVFFSMHQIFQIAGQIIRYSGH